MTPNVRKWVVRMEYKTAEGYPMMVLITPDSGGAGNYTQVEYFHQRIDPMGVKHWIQCERLGTNLESHILASALLEYAQALGAAELALNPVG